MVPLPRVRINIEWPFARTGVDFCGPILISSGVKRVVSVKCYLAVFVCFVTRAVHLELVNGLTSNASWEPWPGSWHAEDTAVTFTVTMELIL